MPKRYLLVALTLCCGFALTLFGTVKDVNTGIVFGETVGDVAGAVGGFVVDYQHLEIMGESENSAGDILDVFLLIVSGYDNQGFHVFGSRFQVPLFTES